MVFGVGRFGYHSRRIEHAGGSGAEALTRLAALVSISAGLLVLMGWSNGVEVLKRLDPSFVAMNPLTAVCFILSGFALGLNQLCFRRTALLFGSAIALIALAKLLDLGVVGLPIDQLLFRHLLDGEGDPQPNRMAPNTAVAFLLVGAALACVAARRHTGQLIAQVLGITVLLISMFALVGYAFGIHTLRGIGPFIPMALHTAVVMLIVGIGIMCLSRDRGLILVLRDRGPSGSMARTVLPLAVSIPVAVGALRLWGQHQGYYGTEAGVTLQVMANVIVMSALLVASILALHRSDQIRREREEALKKSEYFNRTINAASPDCVSLLDQSGNVLFSNEAAVRAFGVASVSELLGRPWGFDLGENVARDREAALAAARVGRVGRMTYRVTAGAGEQRWFEALMSEMVNADDQPIRFIVMSRDITQQRQVEEQVRWTATHDSLTELPNRSLFQAHLDRLTGTGGRDFALLLLDIDDFKLVNDSLGHDAGDTLLRTVAERLRNAVRPSDFVARLAGDEFAIVLDGVVSEAATIAAAEKILGSLQEPWAYDGRVCDCRMSIGASIVALHGGATAELLKNADIALYSAKTHERGRVALFHPQMRAEMQSRASKISMARHALDEKLIVPFYQPQVEIKTRRIVGFEALLRWNRPAGGLQLPASIDAAFDDLELAQEITDLMLAHLLSDMRLWLADGIDFGHVAINVSAADFKRRDFAENLLEQLALHSIPANRIQVEVTETVFLGRGAEYVAEALKTLSTNGIRIALDDFGTGYSSLSHLKQFPVDIVKIDRSFLRDLHGDEHNAAIIRTVISLGRSLKLDVVAEGVETADQALYLSAQGCPFGQGYLFGRAAPAARVPNLIKTAAGRASQAA